VFVHLLPLANVITWPRNAALRWTLICQHTNDWLYTISRMIRLYTRQGKWPTWIDQT